jgi:hypothetical protein
MKRICITVMALTLVAACGGSSGGGGTPTTPETQAAAEAAIDATISAGGMAVIGALGPPAGAQVVKTSYPIDNTPMDCEGSGTYTASGTVTATCIGAGTMTCTITDSPVTVVFTDCAKSVELDGTTYNEVLNGTAGTDVTGTISGNEEGPTAIDASGTLSGTVTLTGDAPGTADLSAVTWTATGVPDPDPTIGCGGTAVVTIEGQAVQNCAVASDCKGCTE